MSSSEGSERPATLLELIDVILVPTSILNSPSASGSPAPKSKLVGKPSRALRSFCTSSPQTPPSTARYRLLTGRSDVFWTTDGKDAPIRWEERGGPARLRSAGHYRDSGARLLEATVVGQLGGELTHEWHPHGLNLSVVVAVERLKPDTATALTIRRLSIPEQPNPVFRRCCNVIPMGQELSPRTDRPLHRGWAPAERYVGSGAAKPQSTS